MFNHYVVWITWWNSCSFLFCLLTWLRWSCELLPSLGVCCLISLSINFHILNISSETTEQVLTKFAEMIFMRFLTKKSSFHLGPTKTCLPCPILVSVWLNLDKSSPLKPQYQINVCSSSTINCSFLFNPTKIMATIGNSFFWLVETL